MEDADLLEHIRGKFSALIAYLDTIQDSDHARDNIEDMLNSYQALSIIVHKQIKPAFDDDTIDDMLRYQLDLCDSVDIDAVKRYYAYLCDVVRIP